MKIFYSEEHRNHYPPYEVFDGGKRVEYFENPDRMDRILSALGKTDWAENDRAAQGRGPLYRR